MLYKYIVCINSPSAFVLIHPLIFDGIYRKGTVTIMRHVNKIFTAVLVSLMDLQYGIASARTSFSHVSAQLLCVFVCGATQFVDSIPIQYYTTNVRCHFNDYLHHILRYRIHQPERNSVNSKNVYHLFSPNVRVLAGTNFNAIQHTIDNL